MKKFYYLLASIAIVLVTIVACEQAGIESDELNELQDEFLLSKSDANKAGKVTICHWDDGWVDATYDDEGDVLLAAHQGQEDPQWIQISISENAVDKHFANHSNGDGVYDHIPVPYYLDSDSDGLGDLENPIYGECEAPEGYVENADDCDDEKLPYSPEGNYTIYRDNYNGNYKSGAILNIIIDSDGGITGDGFTANGDPVTYQGSVIVNSDNSILMIIPQTGGGTHYIGGFVSECEGIIEDLSDERCNITTPNVNCPVTFDYSFTEFPN